MFSFIKIKIKFVFCLSIFGAKMFSFNFFSLLLFCRVAAREDETAKDHKKNMDRYRNRKTAKTCVARENIPDALISCVPVNYCKLLTRLVDSSCVCVLLLLVVVFLLRFLAHTCMYLIVETPRTLFIVLATVWPHLKCCGTKGNNNNGTMLCL